MNSSATSDSSNVSQISTNYRPQGKFSADELFMSIPQNSDTSIQPNSVNNGWFFYQTIDPTICWLYPDFPTIYTGSANQNEDIATYKAITRFPS